MTAWNSSTKASEAAEALKESIRGKTALVTGVSKGGLGLITAQEISKYAALTILAGRNQQRLKEAADLIKAESPQANIRLLTLDLGKPDSIREAAKEVNAYSEPLDCVINNAGIMALPQRTVSAHGNGKVEEQFGTNHLGSFLFTNLIKPRLAASKAPRIVQVASTAHCYSPVHFHDIGLEHCYDGLTGYGQSKTANMLFALSLADKWKDINATVFSLHPGFIQTNLQANSSMASNFRALWLHFRSGLLEGFKNTQQGAATSVYAAFEPSVKDQSGSYCWNCQVRNDRAKPYAKDPALAERLWKLSNELVGESF